MLECNIHSLKCNPPPLLEDEAVYKSEISSVMISACSFPNVTFCTFLYNHFEVSSIFINAY